MEADRCFPQIKGNSALRVRIAGDIMSVLDLINPPWGEPDHICDFADGSAGGNSKILFTAFTALYIQMKKRKKTGNSCEVVKS